MVFTMFPHPAFVDARRYCTSACNSATRTDAVDVVV
jgi:hypothetical protein